MHAVRCSMWFALCLALSLPALAQEFPNGAEAEGISVTATLPLDPSISSEDDANWPAGLSQFGQYPDEHAAFPLDRGLDVVRDIESWASSLRASDDLNVSNQALADDLLTLAAQVELHASLASANGHARLIVVNVPSYTLKAIDLHTGKTVLESRVIVGKPSSRTPIFTTNIVDLKYNPDWSPPPSLARQGKRYVRPGPNNPMGRIRFSADNGQNIYLHHTNQPGLFERDVRALSAGCVRVEKWEELAAFAAASSIDHVHAQVAKGRTHHERVAPIPVAIVYSTADVVEGQPQRFSDVYGRRRPAAR